MWSAIIQAIDHAAGRINKGAGAGIEVAKSQSGGSANSGNNTADTSVFGKAIKSVTENIKDKATSLNNNPKVEKAEVEEEENGTEETEGTI